MNAHNAEKDALAEAIGAVLDNHVGWQMHRGQMVNDLVAAANAAPAEKDAGYARLVASMEALAAEWDREGGAEPFASARLRGLLEAAES